MTEKNRLSSQKQQELISRNQFCERLAAFGWIAVPPEDLGEDFIVHIYFERKATGTSFYVQEKSVTNLANRRKGDFLPYGFKVKDLKHWENFVQPVVLVVWDVNLREGRWILLKDAIKHIDKVRPKWRNQKTKTLVYIPWNNVTNDDGLIKLRHQVGKNMFPIIGKDKELSLKMSLTPPDTWDDRKMAESFEKFYDEGEKVTLKSDVIQSVEIPDWAKPWFDTNIAEITIESVGSTEPLPVDVSVITSDGKTETIKGVELKFVKVGNNVMHLSNEHQVAPLKFDFVFSKHKEGSASVSLNNLGSNVNVTREILRFKQAISIGGSLQLFSIKRNIPLPFEIPIPYQPQFGPDPEVIKLVDYLCTIQAKTGQFIKLTDFSISKQEIQTIIEFLIIVQQGEIKKIGKKLNKQFTTLPPNIFDYLQQKKPIALEVTYPGVYGELLGQKIDMGSAVERITGILNMTYSELEKAVEIYDKEGVLPLQLIDVESTMTFPKWAKQE